MSIRKEQIYIPLLNMSINDWADNLTTISAGLDATVIISAARKEESSTLTSYEPQVLNLSLIRMMALLTNDRIIRNNILNINIVEEMYETVQEIVSDFGIDHVSTFVHNKKLYIVYTPLLNKDELLRLISNNMDHTYQCRQFISDESIDITNGQYEQLESNLKHVNMFTPIDNLSLEQHRAGDSYSDVKGFAATPPVHDFFDVDFVRAVSNVEADRTVITIKSNNIVNCDYEVANSGILTSQLAGFHGATNPAPAHAAPVCTSAPAQYVAPVSVSAPTKKRPKSF